MRHLNTGLGRAAMLVLVMAAAGGANKAIAQSVAPLNSARIVYVGHSLINYEMPDMVMSLANSKSGLTHRRAVQVNPGTNINNNWLNCRQSTFTGQWPPLEFACDAIESGTDMGFYDTLIITQTNNPIIDPTNAANLGTTPEDFERFLNLFLSRNSAGRAFFFTPWEDLGSRWHNGQEWTTQIAAELSLFERVTTRIEEVSRTLRSRSVDVNLIPANLALRDLVRAAESGQFQGVSSRGQLFSDSVHMTALGNYYLACVVFASVYQQSPAGASGRTVNRWGVELTNIDAALALRLQNFAWQVVSSYRGWSGTVATPRPPTGLSVR
jgi:hypothetical protein